MTKLKLLSTVAAAVLLSAGVASAQSSMGQGENHKAHGRQHCAA